jgi:hypothetical protein
VPDEYKYSSQAPERFTQPMIIPAQAIEDRNQPHVGRNALLINENARTLNEPVTKITTKGVSKKEESRWWEWNATADEKDPQFKNRKRSQSSSVARAEQELPPQLLQQQQQAANNNRNGSGIGALLGGSGNETGSGFQTTYQKEHGYMKNFQMKGAELQNGGVQRHSMNPNTGHAVGIVPITDLSSYSKNGEQQRVFVDKMSFDHGYDSRKEDNYPLRGKRLGGYVMEQVEPKLPVGLKQRPNLDRGASVWDAMHQSEPVTGPQQPAARPQLKPPSGKPDRVGSQRRDPIGYFDDEKFGGSMGQEMTNLNAGPAFNPHLKANTREPYNPSWQQQQLQLQQQQQQLQQQQQPVNGNSSYMNEPLYPNDANDLLENAMRYQRPILAAEDY